MELEALSKEELLELINELCDKKDIETYLNSTNKELMRIKNEIDELFFPRSGVPYVQLDTIDFIVDKYASCCSNTDRIIELRTFYLECELEFTKTFGMMGNDFYQHMINNFKQITLLNRNVQSDDIYKRLVYISQVMGYIDANLAKTMEEIIKG